jgi:hypothetical protein
METTLVPKVGYNDLLATLKEEIESCFSDWEGDFSVEIDPGDVDEIDDEVTCNVEVKHKHLDQKIYFSARIDKEEETCEMEIGEDCWCPVTMGNMFASMWFDLAFDGGR